ncbi:hypothetical protein CY34DRAFT_348596 [Suillus luteus UH-Slu-Lm8-n1]|uniref:Unplaced genomic scaffold CY34scaffold_225, whole genome shotgun sequence n=1 Tax=Suillus luteus UH-Slu-Lm8-n1 TaxID=930992 RepID=A0A0D0AM25_9AGAM|nr:hypothetical protein CY34DRAFT_348596 [Suillus luteus UH-Slu-Lm8-n1]
MPPQRRTPIEYDCDACGAHNANAIRFTRHQNRCKAVRIRGQRAYEKCVEMHKKRLAARARAKAERLALAAGEGNAEGSLKRIQALPDPAADSGEGAEAPSHSIAKM